MSGSFQDTLSGLANPARADIPKIVREAGARQQAALSDKLVGELLSKTLGGALGSLGGKVAPEKIEGLAKFFDIPVTEKDRINALAGDTQAITAIANGAGASEAADFAEKSRDFKRLLGIDTSKTDQLILDLRENPEEAIEGLNAFNDELIKQGFIKRPTGKPKTERVKASEIIGGVIIEDLGGGRFRKTKVTEANPRSEEDQVALDLERSKLNNNLAIIAERKQKAIDGAEVKDGNAIATVFDSQAAIEAANELLKDGNYKAIYGLADAFIPTITTNSVSLEAFRDQLVGLLTLDARKKLRGQGTISDSEAKTLGQSATILTKPGIKETIALKEITRIQGIFIRAQERALKNPTANASFEASRSRGPVGFSSALNRNITEQDIQDTLSANPDLTREQLTQQLGIQ